MRWLTELMRRACCAFHATPTRAARVGVLNSGELVLIDGLGTPLVFSTETTNLMRDALMATDHPEFTQLLIDPSRGPVGPTD